MMLSLRALEQMIRDVLELTAAERARLRHLGGVVLPRARAMLEKSTRRLDESRKRGRRDSIPRE